MNQIRNIKGTHDILPKDGIKWKKLESIVNKVCSLYGYREIRTPIFEETNLFLRSVGEDSDIVTKEMYTWDDLDGKSLTLRPELTASIARSYIQHNLGNDSPIQRLFYIGPVFRRERPQKGRQRQFHTFGIEAFGSSNPEQDAEIISVAWNIIIECGLSKDTFLNLNSIGSKECRLAYREALKDFIYPNLNSFSEISKKRFITNPLRILDTKSEKEQKILENAPNISNFYTEDDKIHFQTLQENLIAMEIPFTINEKLVRGLDYYSKTVFEFKSIKLGSQDALLGGGRYDGLVETLGGKPTPGVGFGAGMERFIIAMDEFQNNDSYLNPDIYTICMEPEGLAIMQKISNKLRGEGFLVVSDTLRRSMRSQLREANKLGSKFALIIGEKELKEGKISFKDLKKGVQNTILQSDVLNYFHNLTN